MELEPDLELTLELTWDLDLSLTILPRLGECCLMFDGTDVDNGTTSPNPDPMTNFTTYLKHSEEDDGDAQFKGLSSVMNMLPPHVVQQLLG